MSNRMKYQLWDIAARLCAAIPPLIASGYFFPVWVEESPSSTFSGVIVVAFLVCMIPFWKKLQGLKEILLDTSMPVLWMVIYALVYCLKCIIDSIMYISLAGLAGSLVSMLVCVKRNRYKEDKT